MARHRFALVFLALLALTSSSVRAEEPYLKFVEALRQREYYDTAMEYLEWADARPDLPADIKAVIPFEKATTLIAQALDQKNPEVALATLNKAQLFLEQFLKANPDHPKAAKASSEAAVVLQKRGKVALQQARSPSNASKKSEYIKQAKDYLGKAKTMYVSAAEKYSKEYAAFGPHVDKVKEPEKFDRRVEVERLMLKSKLDSAIVEYEEAQTFEKDDPEYKITLQSAAAKFEDMHTRYRTQVSGLVARVYQGKCFEEQGDRQKALGIYNELLSHNHDTELMRNLQAQVTHFKLICLNSAEKSDYVLVDKLATEWIKDNPGLSRSRHATGIRFEQARALEAMTKDKSIELPEDRRKQVLNEALTIARMVASRPSEYRDQAQSMITRLLAALNRDGKEPKDFDTAYAMARELVNKLKELNDALRVAKDSKESDPESIKAMERGFELHKNETARLLRLALSLRDSSSKLKEVNLARFSLCYVYLLQNRVYDSAVLGEWVAMRYAGDEDSDQAASDCAFLSMAAYARAFNAKGNKDRQADIDKMILICDFIVKKWPNTPKEIDAWDMLGKTYVQTKDYEKAAAAFEKIPPESGKFLDAQFLLGQTLWDAAIEQMNKPANEQIAPDKLQAMQKRAQEVLRKAIGVLEPKLAETEELTVGLANAKLILAQIANQTGQYQEVINLLKTDKRAVMTVMGLKPDETRPAMGPKSVIFSQEVYKQILRAYIGLQDLEKAREAMGEMEKLAEGQGKDILPIYINLGRQFKEELDRLAKSNPQQYQGTLKSFESFLSTMLAKTDGQTFSSLAWMGAMYVSLGESIDNQAEAQKFFAQGSKAYSDLVAKGEAEKEKFCTPDQLLSAKAQLATCKRKAGEFDEAVKIISELLKARGNAIDTQTEAALIFQDWGGAGQTDSPKKWIVALRGDEALPADQRMGIWGWARLHKKMMTSPDVTKFKDQVIDTRYNIAYCLYQEGLTESGPKRLKGLEAAHTDLARTSLQTKMSDKQYTRFNDLYRKIAAEIPKPVQDLPKSEELEARDAKDIAAEEEVAKEEIARKNAEQEVAKEKAKPAPKTAAAPPASDSSTMMILGVIVVIAVLGGGAFFYMSNTKRKSKVLISASMDDFASPMNFEMPPAAPPTVKKRVAPTAVKPGEKPAEKPAAPRTKPSTKPKPE